MKNRLQQFINAENISQSQFADKINVARGSVSHIISGRNKPSYEFIQAMIEHFPMLNVEWLMTGRGKMYRDVTNMNHPPASNQNLFTTPLQTPSPTLETAEKEVFPGSREEPEQILQPQRGINPENQTQSSDNQKTIQKIVVFYTNGTFEEFNR